MTTTQKRTILNILFIITAVIAFISYFFVSFNVFIAIGVVAIIIKVVESIIRFTN